ncbi:conserved hypothetical protein [Rhodococcus jostii RHA1]|uniref:DUF418 domain-containing protein n=1 Tax=Rhodococcus jostii (strain RHA1) TaxID=101510 RepID=Q0SKD3_RHOJR|nr:conserved hypothetical protein [Rhodococcus jostii RHA1]
MTSQLSSSHRYAALDVMRGAAILGTLATNIWIFTNVEGLVGYVNGTGRATGGWAPVQAILQQFAQGKFLGLLTIMFGIGLVIQQRSAQRRGARWPGGYPWRAGLLMLDGAPGANPARPVGRSREWAALRSVAMCCRTSCARSSATAGDSASRSGWAAPPSCRRRSHCSVRSRQP